MNVYLPIAGMSVDPVVILAMGAAIGTLSGLFGFGGGFLMTPILIFLGIPPAVAVATQTNQVVGQSVSGALAQWRRGNVDLTMGLVLIFGGLLGSLLGVWAFTLLRKLGQLDLVISLGYVLFLGAVGMLMLVETAQTLLSQFRGTAVRRKLHEHGWLHRLPLKMRFRRSRLFVSALLPLGIGVAVGLLASVLGIGGGFLLIPALVYMLGMPTAMVVGTALLQIIATTAFTTVLQAATNQSVDLVLAALLLTGAVIGAQFGSRWAARLPGAHLRGLLALIVLGMCGKLAYDLMATPAELFSLAGAG
ncbi:MAG: sulfite exporter TauE/SafE family protein [Alphaproteobacteria bacterium]|nr:sulfite exporter TauE/SafE family protein [Alphaproteobacteria bacterium]